ncbi:MAG: molybdate ABC transporter substrate-binding protein, partial [Myxococcales bacterium]
AAIVYRTDAATAKDNVEVILIPPDLNVVAEYPIAVLAGAKDPALARQFVEMVFSRRGREVLASFGFQAGNDT